MKEHVRLARKIQRTARVWHWLTLAIHLTGSAGLFIIGWQRGVEAIPTIVLVFAPMLVVTALVLRFGGERRTYTHCIGLAPTAAAHQLAAESHHRKGRKPIQDALWWLRDYVTNVTLSVSVGLATDALGLPMAAVVTGVLVMLVLVAAADAVHFEMRMADAVLTLILWPPQAADAPQRPAEGN
jgi:FtsH-binding integral membrane protein